MAVRLVLSIVGFFYRACHLPHTDAKIGAKIRGEQYVNSLNLLSEDPAGLVLLLLEWAPHILNLLVVLEHCVGLGILETHLAETLGEVEDDNRVYAAVLIVGTYANQQ